MSAHVLSYALKNLGRDKMQGLLSILSLFCNQFNNSIKQERKCKILFLIWHQILNHICGMKSFRF